ncbi:hypothetical protein KUCAC02_023609, partial [Chaenocephalus aceratus]
LLNANAQKSIPALNGTLRIEVESTTAVSGINKARLVLSLGSVSRCSHRFHPA